MLLQIAFTASSSSFWRRPVMKTWAPSLTKSFAAAKPIPEVPPVITATFPCNLSIVVTPVESWCGRLGYERQGCLRAIDVVLHRGRSTHPDRPDNFSVHFDGKPSSPG